MEDSMNEYKVSVIMPLYNCEKYLAKTIESVMNQNYTNWEMILVDDCSSDNTFEIASKYAEKDNRIKILKQNKNSGAANARTKSMLKSTGRFVAYLDADDLWLPDKLKKQTQFMIDNDIAFSCTSYQVIDDEGNNLNKTIHMLPKVDYKGFLKNNLLQTVGIMVDVNKIDKSLLIMPDIKRRQDAATWLQILKNGYECYGIDEILAQYRRTKKSLSSNKIKAALGMWYLYREIEGLSFLFSAYCFIRYAFLAVWKRIYI